MQLCLFIYTVKSHSQCREMQLCLFVYTVKSHTQCHEMEFRLIALFRLQFDATIKLASAALATLHRRIKCLHANS